MVETRLPNILDNIQWIYPVGCDDTCRRNLKNFIYSLEKDLEKKLTIVYITDVGMNRGTCINKDYCDNDNELRKKIECSKLGSKRYYIPFPGFSEIKAGMIFYMHESNISDLEPSTIALEFDPDNDLFPEPCVMIRYNNEIKPCYTFGDNDVDEYKFMLHDIPRKYGIEGLNIKEYSSWKEYYSLKKYIIPNDYHYTFYSLQHVLNQRPQKLENISSEDIRLRRYMSKK